MISSNQSILGYLFLDWKVVKYCHEFAYAESKSIFVVMFMFNILSRYITPSIMLSFCNLSDNSKALQLYPLSVGCQQECFQVLSPPQSLPLEPQNRWVCHYLVLLRLNMLQEVSVARISLALFHDSSSLRKHLVLHLHIHMKWDLIHKQYDFPSASPPTSLSKTEPFAIFSRKTDKSRPTATPSKSGMIRLRELTTRATRKMRSTTSAH